MLRTNRDQVVKISVQGEISAPIYSNPGKLDSEGRIFVLPGTGGITYNVKIGDPACGFECDHVEPGVSTKNYDEMKNNAYNYLSCIGDHHHRRWQGGQRFCHRHPRRHRTRHYVL